MKSNRRLENKVALIVGGGQISGETIGNGRATALTFAREGAKIAVADINIDSAQETVHLVNNQGGKAFAIRTPLFGGFPRRQLLRLGYRGE